MEDQEQCAFNIFLPWAFSRLNRKEHQLGDLKKKSLGSLQASTVAKASPR